MLRAIWIACLSLFIARVAAAQGIPSHVVILGVLFISWSEAAHLAYPNKNILNPAVPAVLGMVFEYWGRDRRSLADSLAPPDDWNTAEGVGTLDSVRSYIAHGIPLFVRLELTPFAHQVEPNVAALGTLSDAGDKVSPQQVTPSQWERVQALLSDFAGFGSNVMGKMVSADTLRHWGAFCIGLGARLGRPGGGRQGSPKHGTGRHRRACRIPAPLAARVGKGGGGERGYRDGDCRLRAGGSVAAAASPPLALLIAALCA